MSSIYTSIARASYDEFELKVDSKNKDSLVVAPPKEFGGVDNIWSPEDLFSAAISSCFILTFRSMAKFKKMEWLDLEVSVHAELDKVTKGFQFTNVIIEPRLIICCDYDVDPYIDLLHKAEKNCLVSKSMNCEFILKPKVIVKAKA